MVPTGYPVPPPPPDLPAMAAGMTLRDWFAGQVIAAIFSSPGLNPAAKEAGITPTRCAAVSAYQLADAMLEARK